MRSFKVLLEWCFLWTITGNDLVAKLVQAATSPTTPITSTNITTSTTSNEKTVTLTVLVIFFASLCAICIFLIVYLCMRVRHLKQKSPNPPIELGPITETNTSTRSAHNDADAVYIKVKSPEEEVTELLAQHQRHLKKDVKNLEVSRDNIVNNLIGYYTSEDTLAESVIRVVMQGEDGEDFGGVSKDMFTTFWDRVLKDYFTGCEVFVPFLHTHKMSEVDVFTRFGSILSHTIAVTGAFPFPMAPSAIFCMIFETYKVEKNTVVQDFFLFLNAEERSIFKKANEDFQSLNSEEIERVQNIFFNKFEYGVKLNTNNFKLHLENIAEDVICVKPRRLLECMRRGIPAAHLEHFWSHFDIERIGILLQPLKLSPKRIIERLRTEIPEPKMSNKQRQAFKMLKEYVNEQKDDGLKSLLYFITGSKHMPQEMINILFTTQEGIARSPKAHTCSNTLELPETYNTYDEFKTEMDNVLSSEEAFTMNME